MQRSPVCSNRAHPVHYPHDFMFKLGLKAVVAKNCHTSNNVSGLRGSSSLRALKQ